MATMDFEGARAFVAAVPAGRWTAYRDVAEAAGNVKGAQAIGEWLRRHGDQVPCVYRVLRVDGYVPDGFRPAGPGIPADAASVRAALREEGGRIDTHGKTAQTQRFTVGEWAP